MGVLGELDVGVCRGSEVWGCWGSVMLVWKGE